MAVSNPPVKPVEIVKPVRKTRARAPENESKADKFKRLANHRVPRAIKLMAAIGALGNRAQYEHTEDQRGAIFNALEKAYQNMVSRLVGNKPEDKGFKL